MRATILLIKFEGKNLNVEEDINGNYRFTLIVVSFQKRVDFGTKLLIETLLIDNKEGLFLDLGCGYGPIGIVIKNKYPLLNVHQVDINKKAVLLTQENSKINNVETECYYSDGFKNVTINFDVITLNPPIRAGKDIVYDLYDQAYANLNAGGSFG